MNIIREWEYKLENIKKSILDYEKILEKDITNDMKLFCINEIQSKVKYKNLIEETLIHLKESKNH